MTAKKILFINQLIFSTVMTDSHIQEPNTVNKSQHSTKEAKRATLS